MLDSDLDGITGLLRSAGTGDREALDTLFARVYGQLRELAHWVRRGRAGETMSTTALVHEAYLKLVPGSGLEVRDRAHFFAVAAHAMRQVLMDAARRELSEKRGGGALLVTFDAAADVAPMRPERLLALDAALKRLAELDERQARVVEYRFFAGLSIEETAEVMDVSIATVKRDWQVARAWILTELEDDA
ncbi:MAG: sigma-70 family RNA polymerase sigma factor [Gemmatimonadetes bacterium]|nr:sigma-70 family RNA polymerase sigma factor [Gemmatimonadota bacterium]